MTIASLFGLEDFVSCKVFWLPILPACLTGTLYVVISVDKVIAITFPFKYRKIMTPHTVRNIIIVSLALAVLRCIPLIFFGGDSIRVAEYGDCVRVTAFIVPMLAYFLSVMLSSVLTLILNVYLAVKAYQIGKQIQSETRLSGGDSNQVQSLKQKQGNIRKQMKPVITLLVIVMGSIFLGLFFPVLYIPAKFLIDASLYHKIMDYLVLPNVFFLPPLLHPFVYGLYFKLVREPMMKFFKRLACSCKFNSAVVAPQPQRTAWM